MASNLITSASAKHVSVLRDEVLSFFEPVANGRYVDGTLGMGGHAEALLKKAQASGIKISLLGLDRDTQALALAEKRLTPFSDNVVTFHSRFSEVADVLDTLNWNVIDGALVDIGVSSLQLDEAERGFSFSIDGPLDMRMDQTTGQSAKHLVNRATVDQLRDIITRYGEDPMAGRIARAIENARLKKIITTTNELAVIVESAYPVKWRFKARNHPATRTFQALRMAVNEELQELEIFLSAIVNRLKPGGRVAVISFHSLEDRIVKHFFRGLATGCNCPRHIPVCVCGRTPSLCVITRKPIEPSLEEVRVNSRAGSAKLRVAEKLP